MNRLLFIFFLLAALVKIIALVLTDFDLFGDEAQYWLWSKKLAFGYYSKPPFLAWIISFFTNFIGSSFISLKLIPFIFYFLTAYVVYLVSFELFKKKENAFITAISFYLIPAVSISSFILSTDVVLILFWSLSLLFLLKIRKNPKILNFVYLGIFLGLSFLTKYAAIYFILSLVILMVFDKKIKDIFFKNLHKSSVFILSCVLVLLPNIIWNFQNGWLTFDHTSDNIAINRINFNFFQGIEFILSQAIMLGPLLFLAFIFFIRKISYDFNTKFLLCFSLPIFLIVLAESILVRANANWAAVAIIPFFIMIFNHVYSYSRQNIFINNLINFIFCLIFFALIGSGSSLKVFDRINGISDFATTLNKDFLQNQKYLVVEDRLLYSNLRYSFKNLDLIIYTPSSPNEKIKSHFQLSSPLPSKFNYKFIYLGSPDEIKYLESENKIKKLKQLKVKFYKLPIEIYEVVF